MSQLPISYVPRTVPYAHQALALERGAMSEHFGWLMEMGTGKSKVAVDNICILREAGRIDRALIVAPKGTYSNWALKEIPAHMPERHAASCHVHLWRGGHSRAERDALAAMDRLPVGTLRVLVMNIEAVVASSMAWGIAEKFVAGGPCITIVDESSTIKNPQAQRTKRMIRLGRSSAYRRIATGTPVTRSPLDLWAQFEFLQTGCLGHRSFFSFRARYAIVERKMYGGRAVDLVVGHRDTDKLGKLVEQHALVVRKEDCLDLPPKIYTTREVPLTPEQRRVYDEMREWATVEIEAGRFATATEVIVQLLRLHQVVCGHIVDEQGDTKELPSNRLDVLVDVLDEIQDKTIVWCRYRRDIDQVMERLAKEGRRPVRYDGGTSTQDREEAIYRFQGVAALVRDGQVVGERRCPPDEQADVFVGTPDSGGYGITLTAARAEVYYSNTYDLEKRLQSEDRAHRIGQTRSVTIVDLVARDTVDEKIVEALQRKQNLASMIMRSPEVVRDLLRPGP